jgi:hypothetical protein
MQRLSLTMPETKLAIVSSLTASTSFALFWILSIAIFDQSAAPDSATLSINGDIKAGLMLFVQALQAFDDRLTAIEKKMELHCNGK